MEIEIESVEFSASQCQTRLPFRFGHVTLTEAPVLVCHLKARIDGASIEGRSGDLCVPKWFEKNLQKSVREDIATLFASARRAASAFVGSGGSPFAIWHKAHRRCVDGDLASGIRLVDGFGVALLERAMIDATCRGQNLSFRDALTLNVFDFDPSALLSETKGLQPRDLLADPTPERVRVRHTVGGLDALRDDDVPPSLRGDDDHPVSLEADIRRFGLRAFKLKAGGAPDEDAKRMLEIARLVGELGVVDPIYTLDANESYERIADIGVLLDRIAADPDGPAFLDALGYLEQPLPRNLTLAPSTQQEIGALAERIPLLIDEADDDLDAFPRALDLGYRGVSVKNCKGVFRALTNRALCLARGDGAFQTSEDLTNLPVLPLQQDLAIVGALGLPHSERNGHHFFPGLDVVPEREAEAALKAQPDLYERVPNSKRIRLRIEDGSLSLSCQDAIGFGYDSAIDHGARSTLETIEGEWTA